MNIIGEGNAAGGVENRSLEIESRSPVKGQRPGGERIVGVGAEELERIQEIDGVGVGCENGKSGLVNLSGGEAVGAGADLVPQIKIITPRLPFQGIGISSGGEPPAPSRSCHPGGGAGDGQVFNVQGGDADSARMNAIKGGIAGGGDEIIITISKENRP